MSAQTLETRINRAAEAILRPLSAGWSFAMAGVFGVYFSLATAAPLLAGSGARWAADPIYFLFRFLCHQLPSHSFFIGGQQMACCERCSAIYGSAFVGALLLGPLWNVLPRLPFRAYLALCLPIALDGGTQLIGVRESVWELRVATGALFGIASVWFALPHLGQAFAEMRRQLASPMGIRSVGRVEEAA